MKSESGKESFRCVPALWLCDTGGSTFHAIPNFQDSLSSQPASLLFETATQPECGRKETKKKVGIDSHPEVLSPHGPLEARFSGDRALGVAKGT